MAKKQNIGGIIKSYDPYRLRQQYNNLCESYFHKYFYRNKNLFSEEDFRGIIDLVFEECCRKYNKHRGVDFPGYIKNMLKWGILAQIDKAKKLEQVYDTKTEFNIEDDEQDSFLMNDKLSILEDTTQRFLIQNTNKLTDYDKTLIEFALKGLTLEEISKKLKLPKETIEEDMKYLTNSILQDGD